MQQNTGGNKRASRKHNRQWITGIRSDGDDEESRSRSITLGMSKSFISEYDMGAAVSTSKTITSENNGKNTGRMRTRVRSVLQPEKKKKKKFSPYTQAKLQYHTFANSLTIKYWIFHPYWHWWYICAAYNIALIILFFTENWLAKIASLMAIINVLVGVLIRNAFFLRMIYEIETLVVKALLIFPGENFAGTLIFQMNRALHNIGGIHTGSAIFTVVWVVIYVIVLPIQYVNGVVTLSLGIMIALEITAGLLLLLVLIMCIFATPYVRTRYHNIFEVTHRFCGWSAAGVLIAHATIAQGAWFPLTPGFSLALAIGASVFYPWFLVRRDTNVQILKVNTRAIAIAFKTSLISSTPGTFIRFSFSPLLEWHAFAVSGPVPEDIRKPEHTNMQTSIISRAGDWTQALIERERSKAEEGELEMGSPLSTPVWIHFHTPPGFMFSARGYSEVLFVATGAGIAPILSYLHGESSLVQKRNVLWIGNRPHQTFGVFAETVFAIPDLIVHDTSESGRPVVDELTLTTFESLPNCQAVFVVANRPVTRAIQTAMFSAGIPCYGAEWDS